MKKKEIIVVVEPEDMNAYIQGRIVEIELIAEAQTANIAYNKKEEVD